MAVGVFRRNLTHKEDVMPIDSVSSGSNYVSQTQPQPQTHAERVKDVEREKSREDVNKAAAVQSEPKPTVNTQGQTVGAVINVKA